MPGLADGPEWMGNGTLLKLQLKSIPFVRIEGFAI